MYLTCFKTPQSRSGTLQLLTIEPDRSRHCHNIPCEPAPEVHYSVEDEVLVSKARTYYELQSLSVS